ncbi:glycosyltransferase [Candidatus Daviesbacteria bacterium]|nr:glycosyltransferase [Candidatus Daviesbacteria bacterium]
MKKEFLVSVIIPAFNEQKNIAICLQSLVDQQTNYPFEVIVVDNNSTDKTSEMAYKFKKKLDLKVVNEEKQGRGIARWRGFNEAKGEILLSLDADTKVPANWLDSLVKALDQKKVAAVTTAVKINDCSVLTNTLFNLTQPLVLQLYRVLTGHLWLNGFSFGIKKEIYQKSGGFNPNLQAQEDLDLGFRVAKLGKIKSIDLVVIFSGRRFKHGLLTGALPYFKTFFQLYYMKKEDIYLSNPR